MATIIRRTGKNGQVTFRVQVRRRGAVTLSATFVKRRDALRWAQMTEGAVLEGRQFPTAEAKRRTVAAVIERYAHNVLPQKSRSHHISQQQQLHWWQEQLGHVPLAQVTPAMIAACRDQLLQRYKTSTTNRYLSALSFAFTIAVREWQWCDDNPVSKVTKPKEPRGRVRYLSNEERDRLLAACRRSTNTALTTVVVLALSTGARKMELLILTWPDIDLKRGTITLEKTKNGETRVVPLTGYALILMRQHAKVRRLSTPLVFPNAPGTQPMDIERCWGTAVRRAGITDFRFHDLRHSTASYLAMSGASLVEIAEVLGHKTLHMAKRYTHLSHAHTYKVVERMNTAIFGSTAER